MQADNSLDIGKLLEEIKASPFRELDICAPHTGVVTFPEIAPGDPVDGPAGTWKEKPGTLLATIEREKNPKPICSPIRGRVAEIYTQHQKKFVEANTPLVKIRHYLSKEEVLDVILQKALYLFHAPERAKYYFVPDADKKIKASGPKSINTRDGMELFIMSRMKRETTVHYHGPEGVIYAVYFTYGETIDGGQPLIGVCSPDQFSMIEDVVVRVQTEWVIPE